MKDRILFIDVETGGLNPGKHSLLSVAMVVWEDMKILDSHELFINDGILCVTEEAISINKIDIEKHKQTASTPSIALDKILLFIGKYFEQHEKITIAGHNVQFDISFLKALFTNNNKNFGEYFSHRIIDTSSVLYYLHLSGVLKEKVISSDEAFAYFGIEVEGRHTAQGDAIATARLFTKLLSLL